MKSELYRKYRVGKRTARTRTISGSGNVKGKLVVGDIEALQIIEQKLGRKLVVVKTDHTRHQWIFCEKRGTPRSPRFAKR
jgi:hypothetical protein